MEENKKKLDTSISDDLQPFHNDLLELVQKNKLIPSFLNELAPDDPNLLCLKEAICKANFQVLIWDNPQCDLYLIYLIQKKMIPFWQGITAYVYLIAKMQYTTTQKLRVEDEDVKFNYQVNMVSLVEAGKLTELGGQYLFGVIHALEKLKIYFNLSQVVTFVLNLPPIEQCLIKTEFNHHLFESEKGGNHSADQLIWILLNNIPLIQKIPTDFSEPTTPYLVPSSSLINYFLQAVNEQPMRMRPVFGNPGLKTLYQWHAQNVHPVALYTPHIISNPKDADGYRCGPFPMWFHDIGHVFWTSLLLKLNRDSIFTVFIPALRALKKIAETYRDKLSITYLEEVERKAYDFDLTPVSNYADITTRFSIYIAHTFGKNPNYGSCLYTGIYEHAAMGRAEGDTLYFLLHYGLYTTEMPDAYKEVYRTLIGLITTGQSYREIRIVNLLRRLAKNAVMSSEALWMGDIPDFKINKRVWYCLVNSEKSSADIWIKLTDDLHLANELLNMIEQGLMFFHPYLPLTAAKRLALLDYLDNRALGAKSSKQLGSNGTIDSRRRPQFFRLNSPPSFQSVPQEEDTAELNSNPDKTQLFSVAKCL